MTAIKTLDIKGLDHAGKEKRLFPAIEELGEGETLRIVVDFNPVPLFYLLNANEKFEVKYEKEGPEEWVLRATKKLEPGKKQQLKDLLGEMKGGDVTEETRDRARELLKKVDANTLGALEQELIREGVSHEQIRQNLCDIHLEAIRDSLVAKRLEVQPPHPVNTFMQEHVIILDHLKTVGETVKRLRQAQSFKEVEKELEKLEESAAELVEAEKHHHREEEALFPALEKHDVVEPPRIMAEDHVIFRQKKKELYQLAHRRGELDFAEFKAKVIELGEFLARELESHIFKEDNILYQIALQVLGPDDWQRVKQICDKLGYCCFTPDDQVKHPEKVD